MAQGHHSTAFSYPLEVSYPPPSPRPSQEESRTSDGRGRWSPSPCPGLCPTPGCSLQGLLFISVSIHRKAHKGAFGPPQPQCTPCHHRTRQMSTGMLPSRWLKPGGIRASRRPRSLWAALKQEARPAYPLPTIDPLEHTANMTGLQQQMTSIHPSESPLAHLCWRPHQECQLALRCTRL